MVIRNSSRGFTLVELLVVIAIIGMLVSLLLPAVNAARGAARRTQNNNNLRNIGLAVLSYNESKSALPSMRLVLDRDSKRLARDTGTNLNPHIDQSVSWAFELLPYMELNTIYDRFDRTKKVVDPANAIAMRSPIPVYANPRLREPKINCGFPGFSGNASGPTGTCLDYAANRGFYDKNANSDNAGRAVDQRDRYTMRFDPKTVGPFVHNARVTMAHVRDGQSTTLAIGDRWVGPNDPDEVGLAGGSSSTIMRGPIGIMGNNGPQTEPVFPISRQDPSTDKFGSPPGGSTNACFVYLDGHTEWIDYSINANVFRAKCTIAGGEVILE